MIGLGQLHYYLGIQVSQHLNCIVNSHKNYIEELLNKFDMTECNPISTTMEYNLKLISQEGNEFGDATKYK